ncbi:MAG: tyrosine-type recombinase/integrase, partial [Candidatus Methylomirabilis sp.]|nr:tyrosine-type recombinase/integrase [Deltaproteobacteria bacterium]
MDALLDEFAAYLRVERNFSPHTLECYLREVKEFGAFYAKVRKKPMADLGMEDLAAVDKFTVRAFMSGLYGRNKARTVARKLASLRAFFGLWVDRERLPLNPAKLVSTPKLEKALPKYLSVDDVLHVLDAAAKSKAPEPLKLRNRAIIDCFYATGVRRSELVGLNVADVDFRYGTVRVLGKGARERTALIGEKALETLKAYLDAREGLLHPGNPGEPALFLSRKGARVTAGQVY